MTKSDSFYSPRYLSDWDTREVGHIFCDFLVLGGGIAGLTAADHLSKSGKVILLSKSSLIESNSWVAQGGIAAAIDDQDTVSHHVNDTINAGAGLCNNTAVESIISKAPAAIDYLNSVNTPFDRDENKQLILGLEGGHSKKRILHGFGDGTGRAICQSLIQNLRVQNKVKIFENCFAIDIITEDREAKGIICYHKKYGHQIVWTNAIVLATGGLGQCFRETTNPKEATGDGIAMAWRAGADISDMEFIQFHPTTLYLAGSCRNLISEAVRGEGAVLVDDKMRAFMTDYHSMKDLAPRDIVSRAILKQLNKEDVNQIYLDISSIGAERFIKRFPAISRVLKDFNIELKDGLIPVRPSAHYSIGGIATDLKGQTTVNRLWACGECASTGLHGANRLASNSLLEAVILGQAVSNDILNKTNLEKHLSVLDLKNNNSSKTFEINIEDIVSSIKSTMWRNVSLTRTHEGLDSAVKDLNQWSEYLLNQTLETPKAWAAQNLLTVAWMISSNALMRENSIGVHYRVDFPSVPEQLLHKTVRILKSH